MERKRTRRRLNEDWFSGGTMFGPGLQDFTMGPATYTVQGSATGYVYSMKSFDDVLQQKPNRPSDEYYIYPGCRVRGVGYNNPKLHYTGKVYRILKNANGEVIGLYILCEKTSKIVSIKADDNLTLLLPKTPDPLGVYTMQTSSNMDLRGVNPQGPQAD